MVATPKGPGRPQASIRGAGSVSLTWERGTTVPVDPAASVLLVLVSYAED